MTEAIKVNLPQGPEIASLDTGGITWEDREFFVNAITEQGGNVIDSGFGMGGADLGIEVDGRKFDLCLKLRK